MGKIEEGDEVYAPDGQPTKVVGAHDPRMVRCYRFRFADGQEVVADEDHLWEVEECVTQRRREVKVISTSEMVGQVRIDQGYRYRVMIPSPLQLPEVDLPIHPWLLGAWLGDGSSREGVIHVGEQDLDYMVRRIEGLGESFRVFRGRTAYRVQVYGLRGRLVQLGILGPGMKRVPESYQMASEAQRRQLLAGIMDTDGTVSGGRQLVVTMKSKLLMEDVTSLVRGLGWKASLRSHRARIDGRDAGEVWRVQFHPSQGDPFLMPRKSDQIQVVGNRTRSRYNAIVEIEEVPSRQTRCLTVAHESSMYLVGRGFLPTHNTMNTFKVSKIPRGRPDDPEVLAWFREKCPDYYAQAQEYLRLGKRARMVVVILSLTYPFEMREIHVPFDRMFSHRLVDKYRKVIQMVADGRHPPCQCAPGTTTCPARAFCAAALTGGGGLLDF